jgi:hypothetical protein
MIFTAIIKLNCKGREKVKPLKKGNKERKKSALGLANLELGPPPHHLETTQCP